MKFFLIFIEKFTFHAENRDIYGIMKYELSELTGIYHSSN